MQNHNSKFKTYSILNFTLWFLVFSFYLSASCALAVDANDSQFSYRDYAAVLKTYVDDAGMVNYEQLKANREKLDVFVAVIANLNTKTYEEWGKKGKIAFWLNAYNALTLKVIIDNYPIKPSFFKSRIYPKNSIRQIKGVWNKITFNVMGQDLTLEHIEHKILRKQFDEPRIHMAMVCAAMGCPALRNEPYTGEKLDRQLDDRSRKFLSNPNKFKIVRKDNKVYLSPIFKWFSSDFTDKYRLSGFRASSLESFSEDDRAILNFASQYLKEPDREFITAGKFKIKYLDYDWSLNEQQINNNQSKHPNI